MPLTYNNNAVDNVTYNGQPVDIVKYNGTVVFDKGLTVSYTLSDDSYKQRYTVGSQVHFYVTYYASATINVNSSTSVHPDPITVTINKSGGRFGSVPDFASKSVVKTLNAGGATTDTWASSGYTHSGEKDYNDGLGVSSIVISYKGITKTVTVNRKAPELARDVPLRDSPSLSTYKTGSVSLGSI